MAGEWIPVDIGLATKPEILELCDLADVEPEVAVYRMLQLWGWFSLNSADGTARTTPSRLARVCGGSADWWLYVEQVGWLSFDAENQTATLPGWEERFSGAAKARAQHAKRQDKYRKKQQCDAPVTDERDKSDAGASRGSDGAASPEERRGEENSSSSAREEQNWQTIRQAWADGCGKPYTAPRPPDELLGVLGDSEWVKRALEAILRLPRCKYFRTPPTLYQFAKAGFVERVNGGGYDEVTPRSRDAPEPARVDNSRRRYWRGDAQQNMTDGEYAVWRASAGREVAT